MSHGMLNRGVESMGDMHRGYDKYGKRVHMGTVHPDNSKKDKVLSHGSVETEATFVDGGTVRTKGGLN